MSYDKFSSGDLFPNKAIKNNHEELVQRIEKIDITRAMNFFKSNFSQFSEATRLPYKTPYLKKTKFNIEMFEFSYKKAHWELIRQHCYALHITPALFFHLVWSLVLYWYSPHAIACFGGTREFPRNITKGYSGFFMSVVPWLVNLTNSPTVADVLDQLKKQNRLLSQSVFVPYDLIQSYTRVSSDIPLFDSVIDFKPLSPEAILYHRHPEWQQRFQVYFSFMTHYPCFIEIYSDYEGLLYHRFHYRSDLFSSSFINQLTRHYQYISSQLLSCDLTEPICKISPSTLEEREKMERTLSGEALDLDTSQSLWSRIQQKAEAYPLRIALIDKEIKISYAELIQRVKRVSYCLSQELSLQPGDIVFVDLQRTSRIPIIFLALHRLRICFVPYNHSLMSHRFSEYAKVCGAKAFITDKNNCAIEDDSFKMFFLIKIGGIYLPLLKLIKQCFYHSPLQILMICFIFFLPQELQVVLKESAFYKKI